ncbi:MAG: TolC family outer membrane protein [Pseudomonadota bacterium]
MGRLLGMQGAPLLTTVLATAVVTWAATGAQAETLRSAVAKAIETNPELGAVRHNRLAIDQELRAARGLYLPTVDVFGELGRQKRRAKTPLLTNNYPWHNRRELALIVGQRLFDGFEARYEVERQSSRVTSAKWRVADTANAIALRAIQAYLEIERARAVLAAAQRNVSALNGLAARVNRRVSAGQGNRAERSEAGSRAANGRALVAEARARLQDAIALYRSVVGSKPGHLHGAPHAKHVPGSLHAAIATARASAPSILATDADRLASEAAIGTARSRYYPKLNAEVTTSYARNTQQPNDADKDTRAMLVARWNLYNGGIDTARVREARERASEAAEIAANTQRIVLRETRTSWNALQAARARVPQLQRQLSLARQTRRAYIEQYDAGVRRLLDLLDAQSEVFVADAALQTERLVGKFSGYRVLASTGRLIGSLGLDMPWEAEADPLHWRSDFWGYDLHRHRDETVPLK